MTIRDQHTSPSALLSDLQMSQDAVQMIPIENCEVDLTKFPMIHQLL